MKCESTTLVSIRNKFSIPSLSISFPSSLNTVISRIAINFRWYNNKILPHFAELLRCGLRPSILSFPSFETSTIIAKQEKNIWQNVSGVWRRQQRTMQPRLHSTPVFIITYMYHDSRQCANNMNEYEHNITIRRVRSISTIKRCQDKNVICVCVCVCVGLHVSPLLLHNRFGREWVWASSHHSSWWLI